MAPLNLNIASEDEILSLPNATLAVVSQITSLRDKKFGKLSRKALCALPGCKRLVDRWFRSKLVSVQSPHVSTPCDKASYESPLGLDQTPQMTLPHLSEPLSCPAESPLGVHDTSAPQLPDVFEPVEHDAKTLAFEKVITTQDLSQSIADQVKSQHRKDEFMLVISGMYNHDVVRHSLSRNNIAFTHSFPARMAWESNRVILANGCSASQLESLLDGYEPSSVIVAGMLQRHEVESVVRLAHFKEEVIQITHILDEEGLTRWALAGLAENDIIEVFCSSPPPLFCPGSWFQLSCMKNVESNGLVWTEKAIPGPALGSVRHDVHVDSPGTALVEKERASSSPPWCSNVPVSSPGERSRTDMETTLSSLEARLEERDFQLEQSYKQVQHLLDENHNLRQQVDALSGVPTGTSLPSCLESVIVPGSPQAHSTPRQQSHNSSCGWEIALRSLESRIGSLEERLENSNVSRLSEVGTQTDNVVCLTPNQVKCSQQNLRTTLSRLNEHLELVSVKPSEQTVLKEIADRSCGPALNSDNQGACAAEASDQVAQVVQSGPPFVSQQQTAVAEIVSETSTPLSKLLPSEPDDIDSLASVGLVPSSPVIDLVASCLLYTSDAADDL